MICGRDNRQAAVKKQLFNADMVGAGADMANSNSCWFDAGTNRSADDIRAEQKRLFTELKEYRKYISESRTIYIVRIRSI